MQSVSAGAILAGGDGRRLGGRNKADLSLGGMPLLDHVLNALRPQVGPCAVCVRDHTAWDGDNALPILDDRPGPDRGPMGGIAAGLAWCTTLTPHVDWLVTVPVDIPFLPANLVERLTAVDDHADVGVAASGGQRHYAIAAWRPAVLGVVDRALQDEAVSIHSVLEHLNCIDVEWSVSGGDPFFNINTPDDLALAEQRISED